MDTGQDSFTGDVDLSARLSYFQLERGTWLSLYAKESGMNQRTMAARCGILASPYSSDYCRQLTQSSPNCRATLDVGLNSSGGGVYMRDGLQGTRRIELQKTPNQAC